MSKVKQYQEEMNKYIDEIIQKVEPLSEELIRWKPSEDEWSIIEILCHVEEVIRYWVNELVRVIQAGGTEWGRGLQDEARLAAVRQAEYRAIADVVNGIQEAKQNANEQFSKLNEEDLSIEAPHRNPKFGIKPMTFLVEHFLTEHLANHGKQIERNITKYSIKS
jgi:uncharacterized damage-inducible protein DinB